MANVVQRQINLEGWRNVSVKFTGVIDTANVVEAPALLLSDLVNNDPTVDLWGLRVDQVKWSLSDGLMLALEWNAANPQQIVELAGWGKMKDQKTGGLVPDRLNPGFDGSINLRTRGYAAGTTANYTVTVDFVKLYD